MATVTGNLRSMVTLPANTEVTVTCGSDPVLMGSSLVLKSKRVIRSDDQGDFSIILALGNYTISAFDSVIGQATAVIIDVPDDEDTYDFSSLITGTTVYVPAAPPGSGNPNATTLVLGIVKIDTTMVNPVVVTTTTFNSFKAGTLAGVNTKERWNGGNKQVYSATDSLWHTIELIGTPGLDEFGAPTTIYDWQINQTGEA